MKIKESPSRIVFRIINVIIMILLAFACLAPLLHVFFASISDPILLTQFQGSIILWPLYDATHHLSGMGYTFVLTNPSLIRGYANTFYYVATGAILSVLLCSIGGYCVSRRNTMWMKYLTLMMTFTMFFGGGMIPTYMVNKYLGIVNTRWVNPEISDLLRKSGLQPSAIHTWKVDSFIKDDYFSEKFVIHIEKNYLCSPKNGKYKNTSTRRPLPRS